MAAIQFAMRPLHHFDMHAALRAPRFPLPVRQKLGVMVIAVSGLRVRMHDRSGKTGKGMQESVLGADRYLVGLDRRRGAVDDDLAFGAELVADPAQPDLADVEHARRSPQCFLSLVDERRVDGVHESAVDF